MTPPEGVRNSETTALAIRLSMEDIASLEQYGAIFLGYLDYELKLWRFLLKNQTLIGIQNNKRQPVVSLRVTGKSILTSPDEIALHKGKSFVLYLAHKIETGVVLRDLSFDLGRKWDHIPLSGLSNNTTTTLSTLKFPVAQIKGQQV